MLGFCFAEQNAGTVFQGLRDRCDVDLGYPTPDGQRKVRFGGCQFGPVGHELLKLAGVLKVQDLDFDPDQVCVKIGDT